MAETSKINHDHTYDIMTSLLNVNPSSPDDKDMLLSITSPSSSDTSSDSGMGLSPLEFGGFDLDFSEEPPLDTFDLDSMSSGYSTASPVQFLDNFNELDDFDLSFLDGLDSKTLGKLPELDDTSMPSADNTVPDLERFIDLVDEVKKVEEHSKNPVTNLIKPVPSAPSTVAIVKGSAKITPIIITEIKPAVHVTAKATVRVKQEDQMIISEEEKKLLEEEGHFLPTNVALTKDEEKLLKKVRRKIKNKVSAQESRRKKKEYIDGLESRVKTCTDQNRILQKKIDSLEEQNKTLVEQLTSLQKLVSSSNQSKKQTSTCILVLFLAFALVAFPFHNITSPTAKTNTVADTYSTMSVRSRTLLQYNEETEQTPSSLNISHYLRAFSVVFSFAHDKSEVKGFSQPSAFSMDEYRSMNDEAFTTTRDYSFSK